VGPRVLLRRGIERSNGTYQEAARQINVTPSMLSKILAGERNIAPDLKLKLAGMHILAGLAMAMESTGYRCFAYIDGDRHPQTMIRRVEKEDREADEALEKLPWLLMDKNGPEDLTPEEKLRVKRKAKEILDRVCVDLNLVAELDDRFRLGLLEYLTGKIEKALGTVAEPRATYKTT